MKHSIIRGAILILALCALTVAGFGQLATPNINNTSPGLNSTFVAGKFVANYYGGWRGQVVSGNAATGSASITVRSGYIVLPDGRAVVPFSVGVPIVVSDAAPELITPTAVSGCNKTSSGGVAGGVDAPFITCTLTATFAATHGAYAELLSATNGIAEAQLDAFNWGGGVVVIAPGWGLGLNTSCTNCKGSLTNTQAANLAAVMAAILPLQSVSFEDLTNGSPQYWVPAQAAATVLAAPTTLVAATAGFGVAGANFTGGAYTGSSTYHACIAYVDIMGNEGPCSADFSIATSGVASTDQIGFTAPAASTGAVGYVIYISLAGGTYNLSYQVPLTSSVCTLTKLETTTPACAVANTSYNQSGSAAIVSALTVNTAPLHLLATTASTTAAYIGSPSGRTTYAYVPRLAVGAPGLTTSQQAYAISPAPASTVPTVLGTFPVPIGAMNFVGRTIRVCGQATNASGGTATVQNIEILWDAAGSNSAGAPVIIGQMQITVTQASSPENYQFCWTGQTTVAGSGVTAGSIMPISGVFNTSEGAGTLHSSGPDVKAAAVASLNLAGTGGNTQRIHVVWLHTTGTDAAGTTLQGLTVEII